MAFKELDPVLHMQMHVFNLYRNAHGLSVRDFLDLDRKTDFLRFVAMAYEPFHLTGDPGVLQEMENYCAGALGKAEARHF